MKKKIAAICLVACLAVVAIAGATLAYFTDTKKAENTFAMGNVKIVLNETDIDDPQGDRVTQNEYDVYPGQTMVKDPIVHNVGDNNAYIRATVNVGDWVNECAAYFPNAPEFTDDSFKNTLVTCLVDRLGAGWELIGVERGDVFTTDLKDAKFILKYNAILASGEDTIAIFEHVNIPTGIENGDGFGKIPVQAEAIQADGFTSWEAAFAEFDA